MDFSFTLIKHRICRACGLDGSRVRYGCILCGFGEGAVPLEGVEEGRFGCFDSRGHNESYGCACSRFLRVGFHAANLSDGGE